MDIQQPNQPPPSVTRVASPSNPGVLDFLLIDLLGPLVNRIPFRYKTSLGLAMLVASWLCRAFLSPAHPEYPILLTASAWMEYAALALTGIGIYHKALLAEPKSVIPSGN